MLGFDARVRDAGERISPCEACACSSYSPEIFQEPARFRETGDDGEEPPRPVSDLEEQLSDGAATCAVPPAFPGWLKPSERGRLANARARAMLCRTGNGIEIEHEPCGSRYWLRYGCRTRLCSSCGDKYRAVKRQRFEVLERLHVEGEDSDSSLKFLTLTFPKNMKWTTPARCRAWFRGWTKRLREFLGPYRRGANVPTSPAHWGVRGYLAVWETTAETTCRECGLVRSFHERDGKGRASRIGKRGEQIRGNECSGWKPGLRSGKFHPHLHVLVWSKFIPVAELRARWEKIGGGGQIRLEAAHGAAAVDYVLKYLSKPWVGVPDDLQIVALYRIRRVTSAGEFYGARFNKLTARLMEPCEKTRTGIFCRVCDRARAGAGALRLDARGRYLEAGSDLAERILAPGCDNAGVELEDLRESGRAISRVKEWRTVRTRLLADGDRRRMDAASFATFAWNGLLLEVLDDAKAEKLLEPAKRRVADDGIPF